MASRRENPALRRLLIAVAIGAGVAASSVPAAAQFFWGNGDRWNDGYDRYPRQRYYQPQPRDYYSFPNYGGFMRPPPVVDSTKAPATRKLETPAANTVVVIGDSMADWLAYGLDETYAEQPDIGFERKIRGGSGLVRYDSKNDALEWPQAIKDALATEKPSAIVVMLGLNDRLPLRDKGPVRPARNGESAATGAAPQNGDAANPADAETAAASAAGNDAQHAAPGGSFEFHTDKWAELYSRRIDEMIAVLKSKGVPILWVGLPAIRGPKSTGDMNYLDELYRERAEKAGIVYVDIWDGFVDDQGRYALQGPDFEGQTRRLRTADGVHFTKAGAVKLASYVDRELRRAMSNRLAPVVLPGPEQTSLAKPGAPGPRPSVGPVLPLTLGGAEAGDLAGASGHPAQSAPDPLAAKVLSRGDAIAAPAGRADDFSWPRPGNDGTAADIAPEPVSLSPAPPPKKGAKADDTRKPSGAKADAKEKPAADSSPSKGHRSPSASLDGAPRPPKDLGGGF
jgi:hypothetical protein